MLHNNLSNKAAPVLSFNLENIILEEFSKKWFKTAFKVNQQSVNAINKLFWKDFSLVYVTFEYPTKKIDSLEEELESFGCMFNYLLKVPDIHSLLFWLRQQNSGWYYDTNKSVVDALHPFGQQWTESLITIWNEA